MIRLVVSGRNFALAWTQGGGTGWGDWCIIMKVMKILATNREITSMENYVHVANIIKADIHFILFFFAFVSIFD